ncbi:MAG: flagellar hook-length control protein FliK [Fimbriimonadaceae bacterium]|nr:flagellar hook-length control protein FliK [Fimbriimonadaceae bacterium]
MEPIPITLAWPGGGVPVQATGATTPAMGEKVAAGFASELNDLVALLDSAGEKEATPDGQNATATQLDLIAALVPQCLPLQPVTSSPTAAVTAPVPTVSAPSAAPCQPSLVARAQLAVVGDIAQVVDPGAFARTSFQIPGPTVESSQARVPGPASIQSSTDLSVKHEAVKQDIPVANAAPKAVPPAGLPLDAMAGTPATVASAVTPAPNGPLPDTSAPSASVTLPDTAVPVAVSREANPVAQPTPRAQGLSTADKTSAQAEQTISIGDVKADPPATAAVPKVVDSATPVAQTMAPRPEQPTKQVAGSPSSVTEGSKTPTPDVTSAATRPLTPQATLTAMSSEVVAGTLTAKSPTTVVATPTKGPVEDGGPTSMESGAEKVKVTAGPESTVKVAVSGKADFAKDLLEDDKQKPTKRPVSPVPEPAPAPLGVQDVKDKVQVFRHVREAVADTVRDLVDARRPGQMVLKLQPDDLGTVTVTVKTLGPRVDADVTASDPGLRHALAQHRHDLVAAVERRGLQMGEFTVGHEQAGWDASQNAGHRQQQGQPMRNDFEQAARLASPAHNPTVAVAAYVATTPDSVDYVV